MKTRLFLNLGLVAGLLAACATPATQAPQAPPTEAVIIFPSATAFQPVTEAPVSTQDPGVVAPTQAPVLPVATSRGDALEATDPTTVSLASGQYQFVEFFRFT